MEHRAFIFTSTGIFRASVLPVLIWSLCSLAWGHQPQKPKPASNANQDLASRGRYIVENVAVCAQCHTPHDSQGQPDRSKWLEGGPLWLQSVQQPGNWPQQAPRIAGNPGTDADMIKLLTTGIGRDGKRLRAPMPQFRMTPEDAQAVVAYLRSLTPQK